MGVVLADLLSSSRVPLATLTELTQSRLRSVLPQFASVRNPVDVTGRSVFDPAPLAEALCAIGKDPGVALSLFVTSGTNELIRWSAEAALVVAHEASAAIQFVWPDAPDGIAARFAQEGAPIFRRMEDAITGASVVRFPIGSVSATETKAVPETETHAGNGEATRTAGEDEIKGYLRNAWAKVAAIGRGSG
jgi:acyl-CoA synthetase (NDP forming)